MKLPAYKDILKMSKEKIDAALAPIRAAKAKAQAGLEMCKIDEQLAVLESEITEMCTLKEINFGAIIDKQDKYGLLERRKKQYQKVIDELFPSDD